MKTRALCIYILLPVLFAASNIYGQFSRQQALNIMVNDVVGVDSLDTHHLYSCYESLSQGDTLWLDNFTGYHVCPYPGQWAFFVDDFPIANWAHECRIIFFDTITGNFNIIQEEWPPENFLSNHTQFSLDWEWKISVSVPSIMSGDESYSIYPNPFGDFLWIKSNAINSTFLKMELFDVYGKLIANSTLKENSKSISTHQLRPGGYFLRLSDKNGIVEVKKVVKR